MLKNLHQPLLAILLVPAAWSANLAHADELQRPDPGKRINVFLFAGQSNMEGRADGNKLSKKDLARLHAAQDRIQFAFNGQPVRPLDVYTPSEELAKIYKRNRMFGPELFFGMAMAEAWPDEKFLFIKRAEGATSLHGRWNPAWSKDKAQLMGEAEDAQLYPEFVDDVRETLRPYAPEEYRFRAMLWVQGESDGRVPEAAAAYGATLRSLIEQVRLDTKEKTLPFLLFQVGRTAVVQGMKETAAEVSNVTLIPQSQKPDSADFYQKMENGHYNYDGMKKLGNQFARMYLGKYAPRTFLR